MSNPLKVIFVSTGLIGLLLGYWGMTWFSTNWDGWTGFALALLYALYQLGLWADKHRYKSVPSEEVPSY